MGVTKQVIKPGRGGPTPAKGAKITVHCTGYVLKPDGSTTKFWSTKDTNTPFSFNRGLGNVIRGWDEGTADMTVGEVAMLTMTPDYGYGDGGFPAWGIPPKATLQFEIELLTIQ